MENALTLAHVMGPMYLMFGLSIFLYGKAWQHLISKWHEDHLSLFSSMEVYGVLGLVVINMYSVWAWNVWLLVTITGWALLVKSACYFLLPGSAIRGMINMAKQTGLLYLGGLFGVVFGAVLTYYSYLV